MSNRRTRLAGLTAIAVALTAIANVLTGSWLTTGHGVLVVVEIVGGVAIGRAAIAMFNPNEDPSDRSIIIFTLALVGAAVGAISIPGPLGVHIGNGIHGALISGAVGIPLSFPLAPLVRWQHRKTKEEQEERAEAFAPHEDLVTPVQLPTWNRRLAARVLDTLLLVGVSLLGAVVTGANWVLLALVLWPLYDIVLHAWFGATAGKTLCRICVVDADGAARVGVLRAAGRWVLLVVNVPFIWAQTRVTGDLLWSIDPRLSAMKPVYWGTILITAAERRRLGRLGAVERAAQLAETFHAVRTIPGPLTRGWALVTLAVLVVAGSVGVWLAIKYPQPD
jgi:hypothetical protein